MPLGGGGRGKSRMDYSWSTIARRNAMHSADIRRLGPADEPAFRAMNSMFGRAFDDPETYTGDQPDEGYVTDLLSMDHVIALVAQKGEHVIGGLVAYELQKFERRRREIYIYDLAVDEEHRREGIASSLIDYLRIIAREREAWVIYVQADYGDDSAIALYTRLGVREDVMHLDIPVAD
jgi:aminoglycoside 3-N-acetyltransferase I